MKIRPVFPALILTLGFFSITSCGDDERESPAAIPQTGTITIDPNPNHINAPWILDGPQNFHHGGSGDQLLSEMNPGEYTLTWGDVERWTKPNPPTKTRTLLGEQLLTFEGRYLLQMEHFVKIEPGTFMMGSPPDELGRLSNETRHEVTLTHAFYMSKYEVTEEWWDDVMGPGGSTSQLPKANVSWDDAVAFCNALSERDGLTPAYTIRATDGNVVWNHSANGYRLPTEAEWEYACRANSSTALANGDITQEDCGLDPNLGVMGWYCGNSENVSHPVGQKQENAWGLYDMHGNLWEWCWDGYREDYQSLASTDPVYYVDPGAPRVIRSGSWNFLARSCRSASRFNDFPVNSFDFAGFRLVRSVF